jgi:ferrochelatase
MSVTPQPAAAPRPAVIVLNFGGPRSLDEVQGFLFEILRDPNTIRLPAPGWVQDRLARGIARRRAPEVRRQYDEIGGRSPIVEATERIAQAVREGLAGGGQPLAVYVAHRYLPGDTARAATRLVADGVTELLALPMYPHFSFATTGSSLEQLRAELARAGFAGPVQALRSYPDAGGYLQALAERLEGTLAHAALRPAHTVLLCSAHGLPAAYVEQGDPYVQEIYRTVDGLRRRFPHWRFVLSYQSRVGPAEWLRPYTDQIIPTFAEQKVENVVFIPLAFVNDHIETLYEIGHTYFELARKHGMTPHRVPAIEAHDAFIRMLVAAAMDWRNGLGAVPMHELLPPDQSFARRGLWVWSAWLAALAGALGFALAH